MQDAQLFNELFKIISRNQTQTQNSTHYEGNKFSQLLLGCANEHLQTVSRCFSMLNDERGYWIPIDLAIQNLKQIEFIMSESKKPCQIKQGRRAYTIYGRALSIYRRKKKVQFFEQQQMRQQLIEQVQSILFRLYHEDKLILSRYQSHQLDDILLKFDLNDTALEPAYFGNQVYSPFIALSKTVVMVLPNKLLKTDNVPFLKSTLLHVYIDQCNVIDKISHREIFYKNSKIRGIYFIEQGQVQVNSGRVVARGWVMNGKCRSSGHGWKFKPLYFLKFIARNSNIWKHFYNDALLNEQYPFKLTNILNLQEQEQQFTSINPSKGLKLPKLNKLSFSLDKYQEIEKMRHYDDKISKLCSYKQNFIEQRSTGNKGQIFDAIISNQSKSKQVRKLHILSNKNSVNKNLHKNSSSPKSSSDNILIISVLKKLENIVNNNPNHRPNHNNSHFAVIAQSSQRKNVKINPIQFQNPNKKVKKSTKMPYFETHL